MQNAVVWPNVPDGCATLTFTDAFPDVLRHRNRSGKMGMKCSKCNIKAREIILTQNFLKERQTKYFDFRKSFRNICTTNQKHIA